MAKWPAKPEPIARFHFVNKSRERPHLSDHERKWAIVHQRERLLVEPREPDHRELSGGGRHARLKCERFGSIIVDLNGDDFRWNRKTEGNGHL